jgi:glutamate-ammonia-ligase adenylyltransferase
MRARWRAERDRSNAHEFDLKQGVGGLVDIEFLLQALVLQHAAAHPSLLASGNSAELIATAATAGLLSAEDARALAQAHAALLARTLRCTLDARPRVVARSDEVECEAAVVRDVLMRSGL